MNKGTPETGPAGWVIAVDAVARENDLDAPELHLGDPPKAVRVATRK